MAKDYNIPMKCSICTTIASVVLTVLIMIMTILTMLSVDDAMNDCEKEINASKTRSDTNDCIPNPCKNNGTCYDGINNYTCICSQEYSGRQCESEVDFCASKPCYADANCTSSSGDYIYTYVCTREYEGSECQKKINFCVPNPCLNHANCTSYYSGFHCECPRGYIGYHCETDINECDPNPCLNNGTCYDGVNNFTCVCPENTLQPNCKSLPVGCIEYTMLNESSRNENSTNGTLCDRALPDAWYRFGGDAGTQILTTCIPEGHKCGTGGTGWMDGPHPLVPGGIKLNSICFSLNNDCCFRRHKFALAMNCGSYFVYRFSGPTNCNFRFCSSFPDR